MTSPRPNRMHSVNLFALTIAMMTTLLAGIPGTAAGARAGAQPAVFQRATPAGGPSFEILPTEPGQTGGQTGGPTGGKSNATFGIGPSSPKGPDGRPFFNYLVTPNGALTDNVAVANIGLAPLTLALYATDVVPDAGNGQADLPPQATRPVEAGTWIALPASSATVTVAPRQTIVVPFKVTVPANAGPGDHSAGVVASLGSTVVNPQGERVHLEQRVAARAFFRVSGPLHPGVRIENLHAGYHQNLLPGVPGSVTVGFTVHNNGNIKLAARQRVTVTGPVASKKVASGLADFPLLMPGASARVTVRLTGVLPEILDTAHVTVIPRAPLADTDPPLGAARASAHVLALPLTLLLIIVAIVALLVARKRRRGADRDGGQPVVPGSGGVAVEQEVAP